MTWERIPVEGWRDQRGHVERYAWACQFLAAGDMVADVGHGIGYGAQVIRERVIGGVAYHGFDREPPAREFYPLGTWHGIDLNATRYGFHAHTIICFEVLEHLSDPDLVAADIAAHAHERILVSVPVVPTKHLNEHHLHDFTVADIPPMFPGWKVADEWAQPAELSHVWRFVRC